MIDVYIGVIGKPDSVLALEFDTFAEASEFCDNMAQHYKEERERLYLAIDNTEFEEMSEVYKDETECSGEIDAEVFAEILKLQAQERDRCDDVHGVLGVDDVGTCRRV